ncbi:molecular chaperone [Pantoea sp. BIGb0393]|uniref:Molecular chaperone n=1 Tax=Pantoea nemavictus TaxID=2726955 RepID=A0ABU8PP18_9GAMM|nr:molecular chaperone [Pantoea nemavictus]MBA0034904.1 molecular chaperone [Pantoea nemavictus]
MLVKTFRYAVGVLLLISGIAHAGVSLGGTRVVYDAAKSESNISVKNSEKKSFLIQSWVETEDHIKTNTFIVTPPLFRLNGEQENLLRIIKSNVPLPQDKESLFWLNVKAIPASNKNSQNEVLIAVKTQIKLFYRPVALTGAAADAYKLLKIIRTGNQIIVENPTGYFVSFYSLSVGANNIKDPGYIAPKSKKNYVIPAGAAGKVSWKAIGDYGNITAEATSK